MYVHICMIFVGLKKIRESIEVRESARVVLGDIQKKWCGVLLTLVSCCPRSLGDLPLKLPSLNTDLY